MRSQNSSLALALVAFAMTGACGRDALVNIPPGTPGDGAAAGGVGGSAVGGRAGTGGTAGTGAGGGTGGVAVDARPPPGPDAGMTRPPDAGPAACGTVPPCLMALSSACPTGGACTMRRVNGVLNQCYTNGVRVAASMAGQTVTVRVSRVAGMATAPCYTLTGNLRGGATGVGTTLVYTDGAGAMVGTGTIQGGGAVMLACGAVMPVNVPVACAPGVSALLGLGAGGGGGANACTATMMCP
jgi:hypothetical protein